MNQNSGLIATLIAVVATFTLIAAACGDSTVGVGASPDNPTTSTVAVDPPLGAGPYPIADISVAVHPDGNDSSPTATYRISCLGDTAGVTGDAPGSTTAADMCLALATPEVHDLLVNGAPVGRICTEIYGGPDIATFTGTLDGANIDFTADRVNGCAINDWDSVLAQLLS